MMHLPATRDLVFLGGGHSHALVLRAWAMDPLPGARLTLIDPNPVAPYTGMLPGLIAGHYTRDAIEIDLVRLARAAGARLIRGRGTGIDLEARSVSVAGRPPVAFDLLSVDIGITSDLPQIPGFAEHAASAKPMADYAARWQDFVARVGAAEIPPDIAVIGAGLAGVELALSMAHRLRDCPGLRIALIERAGHPLSGFAPAPRGRLLGELAARGVTVLTSARVARVEARALHLEDGRIVPAALTVAAAGARPQPWLAGTGLALTDGFVTVAGTLASVSHPFVFAAGDCAHVQPSPRPKAGVYAVRQAPVLHHNLRAALMGRPLRVWRAQRDHLKLTALGERRALAEKWGVQVSLPLLTPAIWRLKDRIDAKFMAMFRDLPAMPGPALPRDRALGVDLALGPRPLCGGCGSKLGPGLLGRVLAGLPAGAAQGLGDDAAVLQIGTMRQVIATDHLRALMLDPFLMGRIAAIHALGDIHAMGARPQAALAQIILPPLAEPLQERTLTELMAGITDALTQAGAVLVGGHSTQGAELVVGLTVTGLPGAHLRTKTGARPGDALILTGRIGSGTLLAAEMGMAARGRDIAPLWSAMARDQGAAAALLAPEARAMTDVTGFGLAGHLDEMLRGGPTLGADLDLAALPLWDGAEGLAAAGWASSVAPANRAALLGRLDAPDTPRAALLVDPQTCGPLLAAVPGDRAGALVSALAAAGYGAARIGQIVTRPPGTPAIRAR
jgi:selenide, water dikinase